MREDDLVSRKATALDRKAFESKQTPVVAIGKRDRTTGLHQATYADGSGGRSGEKIFNRVHTEGEVVRAAQAYGSGLTQLDEGNTVTEYVYEAIAQPPTVFACRKGYRNGQIFSCDDEKPKGLQWDLRGSAKKIGNVYQLTDAIATAQVGAIVARRSSSNNWRLDFQFRIYGSNTTYFGDGFACAVATSELGGAGQQLGLGSLAGGYCVALDSYSNFTNNNVGHPKLQIWTEGRRDNNPLADSGHVPGLRSEEWQSANITFVDGHLTASYGGTTVEYNFPLEEIDKTAYFRISAATAAANDIHEIKDIRYSGKKVRAR